MKRLTLCIGILVLSVLACNFSVGLRATPTPSPAPTLTAEPPTATQPPLPTKPSPPTKPAGKGPGRCGDGVCDGPENADNCPQDCAPPESSPTPGMQPTPAAASAEPGPDEDTCWVTNPTSGARLYVQVIRPQNWDGGTLPTLVLIPGGSADSGGFTRPPSQAQRMADDGFTIVVFDPDGRGQSEGVEDDNGYTQQDGLAAIIRSAATLPGVDAGQIGLVSYSYGITMAAGALARQPDLPVRFLIDWEGPANRNDTGGCDEDRTGHLQGHPCDDEGFWHEREASTSALHLQVPYQRLQSAQDHAQPDIDHAMLMIANATAEEYGGHGIAPWTRLNDLTPNTVYTAADPPLMPPKNRELESLVTRFAIELFDLFPSTETAEPQPAAGDDAPFSQMQALEAPLERFALLLQIP
jgi:pimeloyl-ACP methyl ester carboxylesterase